MTVKELSQLYWLQREIDLDMKRLRELEAAAASPKGQKVDDMPRSPGHDDALARMVAEIVDLQAIIEAKRQKCIRERNRLERYISGIDDSLTRQVFLYRFVDGLSWIDVASRITCDSGKDHTEYAVKKRCYRYLREQNKKNQ